MKTTFCAFLLAVTGFWHSGLWAQTVTYIDSASTCTTSCGGSWATAYPDLQDGLNHAYNYSIDEVWVAKGTYFPSKDVNGNSSPTDPRTKTILIKDGYNVYGGFLGNESVRTDRDWVNNKTIINGDIGTTGVSTDNCYHVISANTQTGDTLDGFIITKGNADGNGTNEDVGAGLLVSTSSSIAIGHCVLTHSYALTSAAIQVLGGSGNLTCYNTEIKDNSQDYGSAVILSCDAQFDSCLFHSNITTTSQGAGALAISGSSAKVTCSNTLFESNRGIEKGAAFSGGGQRISVINCEFNGNESIDGSGAALYASGLDSLFINNCVFDSNIAEWSGAIVAGSSGDTVAIANSVFYGNRADSGSGGAIGIITNGPEALIYNCCFIENSAYTDGGAINSGGQADIINCTFYQNTAATSGGAISSTSTDNIKNCIFSSNQAAPGTEDVSGSPTITYSITQTNISGTGNDFGGDPNFFEPLNPIGNDSIWMTDDDGLRIADPSDAYNTGTDVTGSPYNIGTDITGTNRKQDNTVDMGAYEGRVYPCSWDTVFVDSTSSCTTNCGGNWAAAYASLLTAMDDMRTNSTDFCGAEVICVAKGTYKPATGKKRFILLENIDLYGGFPNGGGTRDPQTNPTRLSGDLGGGSYAKHLFQGHDIDSLVVDGFILEDGFKSSGATNGGVALYIQESHITMRNCTIRNNETYGSNYEGGAMHIRSEDEVTVFENCVFENNTMQDGPGGAAYIYRAVVSFDSCHFIGNASHNDHGGAVVCDGGSNGDAAVSFSDCSFHNNQADIGNGGAIFVDNETSLRVYSCEFDSNEAAYGHGGAIYAAGTSLLDFYDSDFSYNEADTSGGAIYLDSEIHGPFLECDFVRNSSVHSSGAGGAVYLGAEASPYFNGCLFESNDAINDGGALFFAGNNITTVANCAFDSNYAKNGGALYIQNEAPVTVFGSVFSQNEADNSGGAFYIDDARVEISNNTIFDQEVGDRGAAIYAVDTADPRVNNTIVHQNTSTNGSVSSADAEIYIDGTSSDNHFYTSLTEHFVSSGSHGSTTGDPNFISEVFSGNSSDLFSNISDYLKLQGISTNAYNKGRNAFCQADISTDIAGQTRIQKGIVDLGAYESGVGTQFDKFPSPSVTDLQDFQDCSLLSTPGSLHASLDTFLSVLNLDPDVDNVTDAFLYAAQWLEDNDGTTNRLILDIPADTYTVGLQLEPDVTHTLVSQSFIIGGTSYVVDPPDPSNTTNPKPQALGINILDLYDVKNASIKGVPGTIIRFEDSLYYGGFNSLYDTVALDTHTKTNPGIIFKFDSCECILVEHVEVDGNFDHAKKGGGDDGEINLGNDGFLIESSQKISLDSIYAHGFGRDGVIYKDEDGEPSEDLLLVNCRLDSNTRQGLSWTGGNLLRVVNTSFSYTGPIIPGFNNGQGNGLVIEIENDAVMGGYFKDCQFYNTYHPGFGVGLQNIDYWAAGDLLFDECTFWSDDDHHFTIWADRLRNTRFVNCTIMGATNDFSGTGPTDYVTFDSCYFSDIGLDGRVVFSYGPKTLLDLADVSPRISPVNTHNAFYRFSNCRFESHHLRLFYGLVYRNNLDPVMISEWECNRFDVYSTDLLSANLPCYGYSSKDRGSVLIEGLYNAEFYSNIFVDKQPTATEPTHPLGCDESIQIRIYDRYNSLGGNNLIVPMNTNKNIYPRIHRKNGTATSPDSPETF